MKRQPFLSTLLLIISIYSHGQKQAIYYYDSLFRRAIEHNMPGPCSGNCEHTGIALIQINKFEDSLKINSLYSSDSNYNYEKDKSLIRGINAKCNQFVEKGFRILAPIYFYYQDDRKLHKPLRLADSIAKKKIKDLSSKMFVMKPVIFIEYPSVR